MKAKHLLGLLSATLLPSSTLACLHYVGQIFLAPEGPKLQTAWIIDDGTLVCDAAWGQTRSMAGFDIGCISGYSMTVGADGSGAWYNTPHGRFLWREEPSWSDDFIVWDSYRFC